MRHVTWRTPAVAAAVVVVYYTAGWLGLARSPRFDGDFYAYGLLGAFVAAPLLVIWLAMAGSRFWENDVGLNLVFLAVATMPENGGLAWVFLFHHGLLTTSLLAWTVIGGPWWVVLCSVWRFWLIGRMRRSRSHEEYADGARRD